MLLTYLNLVLDMEDLFHWYKRKKNVLRVMAATQTMENHDLVYFTTWVLDTSDTSAIRTTRVQREWDTSKTSTTQHKWDTSATPTTQMRYEC